MKAKWSDRPLRPALELEEARRGSPQPDLAKAIGRLAEARKQAPALRYGDYRQVCVSHKQLAFARRWDRQEALVLLNADEKEAAFEIPCPGKGTGQFVDLLNGGETFLVRKEKLKVEVPPFWGRILVNAD